MNHSCLQIWPGRSFLREKGWGLWNTNQVKKHNGTQPQQYNIQKKKNKEVKQSRALVHRESARTKMLKAQEHKARHRDYLHQTTTTIKT